MNKPNKHAMGAANAISLWLSLSAIPDPANWAKQIQLAIDASCKDKDDQIKELNWYAKKLEKTLAHIQKSKRRI